MATNYVRDSEGRTFIAESQRPDGSVRKQRRVRDGFVPQEEVPLYEAKGKKMSKNGNNNNHHQGPSLPPGITPEIWEQMKKQQRRGPVPASSDAPQSQPSVKQQQPQQQQQQQSQQRQAKGAAKPGKGKKTIVTIKESNPVAVTANAYEAIEIDSGVGESDEWTTVTRKSNRKKTSAGDENVPATGVDRINSGVNGIQISVEKKKKKKPAKDSTTTTNNSSSSNNNNKVAVLTSGQQQPVTGKKSSEGKKVQPVQQVPPQATQQQQKAQEGELDSDPAKRLRNLKKRLKEIEELRQKEKSTLGPDQLEKVKRYSEIKKQVAKLEAKVN